MFIAFLYISVRRWGVGGWKRMNLLAFRQNDLFRISYVARKGFGRLSCFESFIYPCVIRWTEILWIFWKVSYAYLSRIPRALNCHFSFAVYVNQSPFCDETIFQYRLYCHYLEIVLWQFENYTHICTYSILKKYFLESSNTDVI